MPALITFLCYSGVAGSAISIRPQDIVAVEGNTIIASGGQRWEVAPEVARQVRQQLQIEPEQKALF